MATRFSVGGLEVLCVTDGDLKTSVDLALGLSRDDALALSGATPDGAIFIPVNNFVFRRDDAIVLIDAGAGTSMQPTLGRLPSNLRAAGLDPADVTHILMTHLHSDHANGLVDADGREVFPNATLLMHDVEHAFWMRDNDGSEPPNVLRTRARNRLNLAPYRARMHLMRDGDAALGCAPVLAPGHSPGHTCWMIDAGAETLVAWGDLVHFSSIQIPRPDIAVTYDLDADRARESRFAMFDRIARDRLAVAGAHVSAPGLGHLTRRGDGFHFQPMPTKT